jgi:hypothetical protein
MIDEIVSQEVPALRACTAILQQPTMDTAMLTRKHCPFTRQAVSFVATNFARRRFRKLTMRIKSFCFGFSLLLKDA